MLLKKLKAKHDAIADTKLPPEAVAKLIRNGALVVDVRSKIEAKIGSVPGAAKIPLLTLKRRADELPRERNIVLFCGTGARAGKAKEVLDAAGFKAFNGGSYKEVLKIVRATERDRAAPAGPGR
jgi:rhodanese-related sulfurtransferase